MKKLFALITLSFILYPLSFSWAINLTSVIDQETTGSSAASARQSANNAAIRSAAHEVLGRFADRNLVFEALAETDDARLLNMVSSTSISNERTSRTAYSARFTIAFSRAAMERWYAENNIVNFMDMAEGAGNRSLVIIEVRSLTDWAALKAAMREDSGNFNLQVSSIFRNSATAYVNSRERFRFQTLARNNGWHASSSDGILRLSRW